MVVRHWWCTVHPSDWAFSENEKHHSLKHYASISILLEFEDIFTNITWFYSVAGTCCFWLDLCPSEYSFCKHHRMNTLLVCRVCFQRWENLISCKINVKVFLIGPLHLISHSISLFEACQKSPLNPLPVQSSIRSPTLPAFCKNLPTSMSLF